MKRIRIPAVLFAALLQMAPLCRTICTSQAVPSTLAIILRWTVGATAAIGAFDSVSGASQVYFTNPTNATGYVGTFFQFTNTLGGTIGSDPGANIAAAPLPTGLTNKTYDLYFQNPPKVYGVISGFPTTPVTNMQVTLIATHPSFSGTPHTNLYITILPASPPVINNPPASITNVAGSSPVFSVTASGSGTLRYQWRYFVTNALPNATNSSVNLTNVRLAQAGDYTVVITNASGGVTSSIAKLTVSIPPSPALVSAGRQGENFRFSFNPVTGLTNTILTNSDMSGLSWGALTNFPPPSSPATITVSDPINSSIKFYRVSVSP